MSNFITATQSWVRNRINEVKSYCDLVKENIKELITALSDREQEHFNRTNEQFGNIADKFTTGTLTVEGETTITGGIHSDGIVNCMAVSAHGPYKTHDPSGLIIESPKGPAGFSVNGFSIANDRGKLTRFFMVGDALFCDYHYDMIYTYFDAETGSNLRYLHRGGTKLQTIVDQIELIANDAERIEMLESWFNDPKTNAMHKSERMFKLDCNTCFPSTGVQRMIPESMIFTCPSLYKLDSIKVLDKNGQTTRILKDLHDYRINKLLVNFPYVHSVSESNVPPQGAAAPRTIIQMPEDNRIYAKHIADFDHGYYEFTDPEAVFYETCDSGLLPNVIINVSDFPKDEVSIIHFDVKRA